MLTMRPRIAGNERHQMSSPGVIRDSDSGLRSAVPDLPGEA